MLDMEKAKEALEATADLLEKHNIKYWIDSGTLLGAYRQQGFIVYDHDIDIRCLPGQVTDENVSQLIKELWEIGYTLIMQNKGKRAQFICIHQNGTMLDLKFAYQDGNLLWIYCWRSATGVEKPRVHCYPRKFFRHMGEIELYGRKYPTPAPVEEYIVAHYGKDWRKFKDRAEKAEETDLTWDYMHDPPSAMSLEELAQKRAELSGSTPGAVKSKNKQEEINESTSKS